MLTFAVAASGILALSALGLLLSMRQRVNALSQAHWELHYEFGRLRARVAKLDGGTPALTDSEEAASASGSQPVSGA
jgi:hypothetical protein